VRQTQVAQVEGPRISRRSDRRVVG